MKRAGQGGVKGNLMVMTGIYFAFLFTRNKVVGRGFQKVRVT